MATVSNSMLEVPLSLDHKRLIEEAAELSGQSLASFSASTLVETARRVVDEHRIIHLSARDRDLFLQLLDNPPEPNERLRRAAEHYRENFVE